MGTAGVDVVVVPTAPTHWTTEEVLADPIKKNSVLGEFTHCGNVLDLCAVAVPAGTYAVRELSGREEDGCCDGLGEDGGGGESGLVPGQGFCIRRSSSAHACPTTYQRNILTVTEQGRELEF